MKYLLPIALAAILGSCSAPPPEKRINILLENKTDQTLILSAKAGWLGRALKLKPGEAWYGWIPRSFDINEIRIEVREPKAKKRKKRPVKVD